MSNEIMIKNKYIYEKERLMRCFLYRISAFLRFCKNDNVNKILINYYKNMYITWKKCIIKL